MNVPPSGQDERHAPGDHHAPGSPPSPTSPSPPRVPLDFDTLVVSPRVLRRVIKKHHGLPGLGAHVPHAHCHVTSRDRLRELVSRDDLPRPADALAPTVLLVAHHDALTPDDAARTLWRHSFHALVHAHLDRSEGDQRLDAPAIKRRIHDLGQTEFDEIRRVLRQDDLLLASEPDRAVYIEFAATYLDTLCFDPADLERAFPTLVDRDRIERLLTTDVDVAGLLAASRPAGAPELAAGNHGVPRDVDTHRQRDGVALGPPPSTRANSPATEPTDATEDSRRRGNLVRAALSALSAGDEAEARRDLDRLVRRFASAVTHSGEQPSQGVRAAAWADDLAPLLFDLALTATRTPGASLGPEARLLFDIQRACVDRERGRKTVDVMGALLSLGRRAVVRSLPAEQEVLVVRHTRAARAKVTTTGLPDATRARLLETLGRALELAEASARAHLTPRIRSTLSAVGVSASTAPERVAERKLVDGLVDQIVERGHIGFGQLRDALSSGQLKLGDVNGPGAWVRGDALLRADEQLSVELDGVYHRGEIYMRWLEKLSALFFGTAVGRQLTLHLLLPTLVAFVALEGVSHLVAPIVARLSTGHAAATATSLAAPPSPSSAVAPVHVVDVASTVEAATHDAHAAASPTHSTHFTLLNPWSLGLLSVFLWGCIHSPAFRGATLAALRAVGRALHGIVVALPRAILAHPAVRAVLQSSPVRALGRYAVKPSVPAALALGVTHLVAGRAAQHGHPSPSWLPFVVAGGVFASSAVGLNSGIFAKLEEVMVDWAQQRWLYLQRHLLPGFAQLVQSVFGGLLEGLDRALYTVDEWLRFKEGQPRAALWGKGALGVVWFFVTYLVRLYATVLVEPQVNPIKHFPVVTVSHKIILPMTGTILEALREPLMPLGAFLANTIAGSTVFLLPGMFGFIVWELKGNWGLYAANRPADLEPVRFGHHGETLQQLLEPGFHSGTLPRLFEKIRRAARRGRPLDRLKVDLEHIEHAVGGFIERELIALLDECGRWGAGHVRVDEVRLASNRIRVALALAPDEARAPPASGPATARLWLQFEEQSGFIVASVPTRGFLDALGDEAHVAFEAALAGLYKFAAVELVREQLEARLGAGAPYDICDEGLVVWNSTFDEETLYALDAEAASLEVLRASSPGSTPATLVSSEVVFVRQPITWAAWQQTWAPGTAVAPSSSRGLPLLTPRRAA